MPYKLLKESDAALLPQLGRGLRWIRGLVFDVDGEYREQALKIAVEVSREDAAVVVVDGPAKPPPAPTPLPLSRRAATEGDDIAVDAVTPK